MTMPALHPRGVNHLALSTRDMKAQLQFWGDVLGCPTKALYWMHGVKDTFHGFVELGPQSYVAFVQHPANAQEIQWGVTHAGNPGAPVTAGAMQHVALHVDTVDEVRSMRDRIRSHGVQVLGPIDHGFIQSIYFAGPEGLTLEICCGSDIPAESWIDPEVQALCGIDDNELARLKDPAAFTSPGAPVPQPPIDPATPQLHYPPATYAAMMGMDDDLVWERFSETDPPVPADPGRDATR